MAQHVSSDSDDEFHSMSPHTEQGAVSPAEENNSSSLVEDMAPPVHPIPSFQHAFEESIVEAADGESDPPSDPDSDLESDAEMRRQKLLEAERYEDVSVTRWKQRPGAKYHPFVKLMAQIVFGMHLLQLEQAKSNEAVVKILQNHVNDVDNFLERTSDDFDLALTDIEERIRYLQLPMQHMDIFEVMLDEKKFRTDLLYGNEKIEKIIGRTAKAMQEAMADIESGLKCTRELHEYLATIERKGPNANKDIAEVFNAMRGNQQGWMKFLSDLQIKGNNLSNELVSLGNTIAEIARLAGEASRRNKPNNQQSRSPSASQPQRTSTLQSKFTKGNVVYKKPGAWLDKPLPKEPGTSSNTLEIAMPKPHPVPFSTRFEQPRERAPTPGSYSAAASSPLNRSPAQPQRPRTSGSADPRTTKTPEYRSDLRKHSNPLRSHPPDGEVPILQPPPSRKLGHSQSHSAGNILNKPTKNSQFRRSKSSGNVAVPISMAPSTPTSKKVVEFDQRKGSTKINFVPKREEKIEALPSISTGFSRRLSLKLRQIPAPLKTTTGTPIKPHDQQQTTPKPIDSAYSSDRKRSTSSPTNFTSDTDQTEPPEPIALDAEKQPESNKFSLARDGSRLALFPKVDEPKRSPLPPASPHVEAWGAGFNAAPQVKHASKASRTFSIARFFHRKNESRIVTA